MKKGFKVFLILLVTSAFMACGSSNDGDSKDVESGEGKSDFKITMVADVGGINDQSYNQGSWEGLQELTKKSGVKTSFVETVQMSDLDTNFDKAVDGDNDLIWGIGFNTADPLLKSAKMNPSIKYAIIDHEYEENEIPENVTSAVFNAEQGSFIVGYIAGLTTESNKVAYIGGMRSPNMDLFEYGFSAGVEYAAKELGKDIEVSVQIIESFSDAAKGKATAASLYSSGHDVIFVAAGAAGTGAIEEAVEDDKWIIGVDRDQSYLAPENMLTSALKNVGIVTEDLSQRIVEGEELGGKTIKYGVENNGVGIPEEHPNLSDEVYNKALEIEDKIKSEEIVVPQTKSEYDEFFK